jgi:protease secretion system membrane fusion protein
MTQQEFLAIAKRISGLPDGDRSGIPVHADVRRATRLGGIVIALGVLAFLVWAFTAPIDEGVPAHGTVVVESMRKTVTHAVGGTIDTIHVKENQFVKAGDALITLKGERARNALETVTQEYLTAAAKLARLRAEQEAASAIEFPEDLVNLAEEQGKMATLKAQQDLFETRRQALASEQAILRENLAASQAQVKGLQQQAIARQKQYELHQQEIASLRPLVDSGYNARNSLLDAERRAAELSAANTEIETRIARELGAISELRLRMLQSRQNFLREVETQLAETRSDVLKLQGMLSDARSDLDSKRILAPVAGQVVSLHTIAAGSALNGGSKILEIVPENEALLIDAQIPAQIISSVSANQAADIRITAFAGQPQLVVPGQVMSISSDIHEAQPPMQPYYLARIAVTPEGMERLGGQSLRPGMSVDIVIKTGERSLIAYLMRPIMKQLFFAMKEQ